MARATDAFAEMRGRAGAHALVGVAADPPPRRQAGQHPPRRRVHRQGVRLRHVAAGAGGRRGGGGHAGAGDARVPGPGVPADVTCQLTGKSGVYSFAVVLLGLLTGRKAFAAEDDREDGCLAFSFLAAAQAGRHRELMEAPTMKEVASKLQTLTRSACSAGKTNGAALAHY
ncbi:unnamed protein product [Urochloa humidicola]